MIPKQLINMRFNRVQFKEKKAFEKGWQKNPHSYEKIQEFFPKENYGVMCGKELRVLDDDTEKKGLIKIFKDNFGETFQVRDHLYFKFDNGHDKKIIFMNGKYHLGELQGEGTYVVGPGSIHPSGETYEVKNDLDIITISYDKFIDVFGEFIKSENSPIVQNTGAVYNPDDDEFVKNIKEKWISGNRETLALSVAGYLRKKKKFGLLKALGIVEKICKDCGDEEVQSRLVAVRATYDKDEKDVKGITGLVEKDIKIVSDSSWKEIKKSLKDELGDGEEYYDTDLDWRFIINNKDKIIGKPQLIDAVKKNIVLGRETIKKDKVENVDGKRVEKKFRKIYLFDDRFDKRHSGPIISTFSKKYFLYRIIEENGGENYILSEEYLPNEVCEFSGMRVEVEDFAEISKSMRIGCLTSVFFLSEYKSNVVILPPKDIVEFTKNRKISEEDWLEFLAYHRTLNSFNRFPKITEILKSAHLLSSKVDGWPLHLGVIGPQGSRKSKGFIETIAYKMGDNPDIVEGANSRIKGLTPSFKEKPANLGYLANCNRMGWVDELGKMVEFEINKHQGGNYNVLGEANFLLEHSIRQVSSGNDNTVTVGATAKFTFVMNPISKKNTIYDHVGAIDPTTMSRILWWVQDFEEQEFVMGKSGIVKIRDDSPLHHHHTPNTISRNRNFSSRNYSKAWLSVGGKIDNTDEFLTLFDSCNDFKCKVDYDKIEELMNYSVTLAREPMKSVWKPRSEHHIELLVDGVCKHRCLFIDYDSSFEANDMDYETTKAILTRMIKAWDTNLSTKGEVFP